MKPRASLEKLKSLLLLPKFTSREALALGVSTATLSYYIKTGGLVRIGHGIYRGAHAPVVDDFRWEDLIETMQKTKNGVICLVSALSLYGLTEEIPREHWIAVPHETRHRAKGLTKVIRMRNTSLGKTTFKIGATAIPIFDRERTIVDAFRYLSREVALKAAIAQPKQSRIDREKLRKYAKKLRVKIDPYLLALSL